jgi:antitoxin ParD1/3/4
MTMNVSLTPELEKFVNDKVSTGMYSSASEVIRESLRRLRQEDELRELQLNELRGDIRKAVEEFESGKGLTIAEATKHLKRRRAAKSK